MGANSPAFGHWTLARWQHFAALHSMPYSAGHKQCVCDSSISIRSVVDRSFGHLAKSLAIVHQEQMGEHKKKA